MDIEGHISNIIAKAICVKLKLLLLDERDIQLKKKQYINTTAATCATAIAFNSTASNTNTTTIKNCA